MRKRTSAVGLPPPPPIPEPPKTAAELAREREQKAETLRLIREIRAAQIKQNLARVERLVQMAQRGQGPLIDYFTELGFKYQDLADNGPIEEQAPVATSPIRRACKRPKFVEGPA